MIDEILDKLEPGQRSALMYAFNEEFSFRVDLPDGGWIGVHIQPADNLVITEQQGVWSTGQHKEPTTCS